MSSFPPYVTAPNGLSISGTDQGYRITSSYFCAGLDVAQDGVVVRCAPILRRRFFNTNIAYVRATCVNMGWVLEQIA